MRPKKDVSLGQILEAIGKLRGVDAVYVRWLAAIYGYELPLPQRRGPGS